MSNLPLKEEILDPQTEICPMCGSIKTEEGIDRPEHSDMEIVRKLALFMVDDWKACCILLLYVAKPNSTIDTITQLIRVCRTEVFEARMRAVKRFPDLASILGLKTPQAIAQRARRQRER